MNSKDIENWKIKYGDTERRIIANINADIAEGSKTAYDRIVSYFEDEELVREFETRQEMSYIMTAVNIYFRECAAGEKVVIFDHASSVDELMAVMNQIRFLAFEYQFLREEESLELLRQYVASQQISMQMLYMLMEHACVNEEELRRILDNI